MANEMIEQVARALCNRVKPSPGPSFDGDAFDLLKLWADTEEVTDYSRVELDEFRAQARTAIKAMRVPTEAMIDAGVSADTGKTLGDRVANCHRAMIDAALSD